MKARRHLTFAIALAAIAAISLASCTKDKDDPVEKQKEQEQKEQDTGTDALTIAMPAIYHVKNGNWSIGIDLLERTCKALNATMQIGDGFAPEAREHRDSYATETKGQSSEEEA